MLAQAGEAGLTAVRNARLGRHLRTVHSELANYLELTCCMHNLAIAYCQ